MKLYYQIIILFTLAVAPAHIVNAQLNMHVSQYYQNQYLGNPAFAGIDRGLVINAGYRNQLMGLQGAPISQYLTGELQIARMGIGLHIQNEKAGFYGSTRVLASYAYHLPLNKDDQALHFGLSLGVNNQRISQDALNNNPTDPLIAEYNNQITPIDADFGVAYTDEHLTVQTTLGELKNIFYKKTRSTVNQTLFFSAISYKFSAGEDIELEPKVCYRSIKGFDDIIDFGTNVTLANKMLSASIIYHSNKSTSLGVGYNYQSKVYIQGMYTSYFSAFRRDTNGGFELSLKVPLMQ